tara:strand:+ start:528 stop:713 length:186 start_codon:yes stop_codon:yes gene_type:complete
MVNKYKYKKELHTMGYKNNYTCILYYKGIEQKRVNNIKTDTCNKAFLKAVKVLDLKLKPNN